MFGSASPDASRVDPVGPQTVNPAFGRVCHPRRTSLAIALLCAACGGSTDRPIFELLAPERTGVTFANTITASDSLNVLTDIYIYNGAGVGIGDIDNDGLPDFFF